MAAYQILFARQNLRKQRIFRDRNNPLDILDDDDLIKRYRFPRDIIFWIIDAVKDDIELPTRRSKAIPASIQVLSTLRFLAKGDYQSEVGDLHGISCPSMSRVIQNVARSINRNIKNIKFPRTEEELRKTKEAFHEMAHFPSVIGAVDGTLIPIQGLSGDQDQVFIRRKGFYAINVMAVVDHQMNFINIVVKWPGGTHDAFVLQQSALFEYMENHPNGFILGDSGYPLKAWLMTPILEPSTPQEEWYNRSHCRTRNVVERAFGVLKQRFRCLHKTGGALSYKPERCTRIIEACFRLHNLAQEHHLPIREDPLPMWHNNHIVQNYNNAAIEIRRNLINRF